jgi:uncharacterized membrane protein
MESPTATPLLPRLRARLRSRVTSGIVVLVPIVVTVAVLRFLFGATSSVLLPLIDPAVDQWAPSARAALSLGVLLVAVYVLGEIAANIVGRRVLGLAESVVLRVPLVKVVYSASKQVAAAFQGRKARAFKSVVLVEFPAPGMQAVAFVTGDYTDAEGNQHATVFVPTTPNPTTGFLQIVPVDRLVRTPYTVEDGIKMVMSLGVLVPPGPLTQPSEPPS